MKPTSSGQTVVIRFCAPTQSWGGECNHWELRRSRPEPTWSGVVGLLGNACGLDREADVDELAHIAEGSMWVRVDSRGQLRDDLQSVQGTINTKGKAKEYSILSRRQTIFNGCFTVFMSWPDEPERSTQMLRALQHPARVLMLGRRCHPLPADAHVHHYDQGVSDELIASHPHCEIHPPRQEAWTVVGSTSMPLHEPGVESLYDKPIGLRKWEPRRIRTYAVPVAEQAALDTGHSAYVLDGSMRLVIDDEAQADAA